jgi:hypothetical protein
VKTASVLLHLMLLVWLAMPPPAAADPQSKSFSHWRIDDANVTGTFTIPLREVMRLTSRVDPYQLPETWHEHLRERVHLSTATPCELLGSELVPSSEEYARARLKWRCQTPVSPLNITLNMIFDQVPSHVHFANFRLPEGVRRERLFSQFERSFTLAPESADTNSSGPVLTTYIRFGFEHILIGLDHVAFLLTLLLLSGSWRQLLWVISGFTLGHSVTLSLSALGLVTPDIGFIEALIGLSIALVAVENVSAHSPGRRGTATIVGALLLGLALLNIVSGGQLPSMAMLGLAFGLIHGFGFASVLMEVGLPETSRPLALLGFNIGVELGQIVIVSAFLLAGILARRILGPQRGATAVDLLSSALCALGVYWFLQRLYF